ncbi:Thrombospondin-4, partial [Araneus ventricosus]
MNSDPGLAVGFHAFGGVDFEGTFFVDTEIDDDYVGFVFRSGPRWPSSSFGTGGVQVRNPILLKICRVRLLWRDPKNAGWREKVAYRWLLLHRPKIGLIRLRIFEGENMVADSGNIFDSQLKGGRLGVFCFSQEAIIWSDLVYRCNEAVPSAIYNELPRQLQSMTEIDNTRSNEIIQVGRRRAGDFPAASGPQMHA